MAKVTNGQVTHRMALDIQHFSKAGLVISEQHKESDLVVATGLQFLNRFMFGVVRPTILVSGFRWTAIGAGATGVLYGQASLWHETQRMAHAFVRANGTTGKAYISCTFNIPVATTLYEVGLFGTLTAKGLPMYCRDTYAVKNVGLGDQVRVIYTSWFATT